MAIIFYVFGSVIGLILMIGTIILYCHLPVTSNSEARILIKKTFAVILTFLVNIVIMVFALLVRVMTVILKHYDHPGFWYSFGITFPISLLLFPVVYGFASFG